MKKLGVVLLIIVFLLCSGAAFIGFIVAKAIKEGDFSKISSLSFLNKSTSTDLGITFVDNDKTTVHDSIKSNAVAITTESPECKTMTCISGQAIYIGTQNVSTVLSNSQGTALINEWIQLSPNAPFTSAQMKVNTDGSVDFAATVDMKQVQRFGTASKIPAETMSLITKYVGSLGETFPLKASGTATIKNNNVDVNFTSLKVGFIPVPNTLLTQYKKEADSFIEDRLEVAKGLSIEELSFANGKTTFKGVVPKTIYFVK